MKRDADFLGAQFARWAPFRQQTVAMRRAVLAAKHAARPVAHALAGGIAERGLCRLQHHVEGDAESAAKLTIAAGAGAEFVMTEVEREAHLGHFDAAELQAANAVPFADRGITVATRRCATTGPRLKHVPDEIAATPRVLALDGDTEAPAPAG